jgi:hypothetical protein
MDFSSLQRLAYLRAAAIGLYPSAARHRASPLTDDERAAVEDGQAALDALRAALAELGPAKPARLSQIL